MTSPDLLTVTLCNVALESFLYGTFFVLNAGSIVLLISPRHETPSLSQLSGYRRYKAVLRKPMFVGALLLFMSNTGHWITTVYRMFAALKIYKGGSDPLEYYADISQPIYSVKTAFIEASLVVADAMLVYRLWLVYNRNYPVIVIPVLTSIGLIVCAFGIVINFSNYPPGRSIFSPESQAWVLSDGIFTLLTNVYSTVMIGWRIWWTERQSQSAGARVATSSNLLSILAIFVESALLYTSWTILFIATYGAQSHVEAMVADCWGVVAGISFGLINVRMGLGCGKPPGAVAFATSTFHRFRVGDTDTVQAEEPMHPLQMVTIHVHQVNNSAHLPTEAVTFPDGDSDRDRRLKPKAGSP